MDRVTDDDITDTLAPKSDQLNADDLITGPVTVTVLAATKIDSDQQPISIEITGHKPYKPCKSMRRVLASFWGKSLSAWVGRSMTLYRDPKVIYAGQAVGGVRISHMSHIEKPSMEESLTVARGKRTPFVVKRLEAKQQATPGPDLKALFDRVRVHIPDFNDRKQWVRELGVTGDPLDARSWTADQLAAAERFCASQEGGGQ